MAHPDPLADQARQSGVDMDNRKVLDVALLPYHDGCHVAAEDGSIPDAGTGLQADVADDHRPRGDEGGGMEHRPSIANQAQLLDSVSAWA